MTGSNPPAATSAGSAPNPFAGLLPDPSSLKSADDLAASMKQTLADAQARLARTTADMAANVATVTSTDGAVTVSVTATGSISSVRFSTKAESLKAGQLSSSFMATYRAAARQVMERSLEILDQNGAGRSTVAAQVRAQASALLDEDSDTEVEKKENRP